MTNPNAKRQPIKAVRKDDPTQVYEFDNIGDLFDFLHSQHQEATHCNGDCDNCELPTVGDMLEAEAMEAAEEIAEATRILFDAFINEGFTEAQATKFTMSIIGQ